MDKKADKKKGDFKIENVEFLEEPKYLENEHALVTFNLRDILNPCALQGRLSAVLTPREVFEDTERANLELNKTARKKKKLLVKATEYLSQDSRLTISFRLLFPLDRYQPPKGDEEEGGEEAGKKSSARGNPKKAAPKKKGGASTIPTSKEKKATSPQEEEGESKIHTP